MPALSIVLPTRNERDNLPPLIRRITAALADPIEIIVVDDDSPDGTADAAEALATPHTPVRVIRRPGKRNLVSAIQRGIDEAHAPVIAWMDADLSMPPESLPALLDAARSGRADIAVGSRFIPGASGRPGAGQPGLVRLQGQATRLFNRLARLLVGIPFHDWTSGFLVGRADVLRTCRLEGGYGDYFILLVARLSIQGARIIEMPYAWAPRQAGSSKTASSLPGLLRRGGGYLRALALASVIARGAPPRT